MNWGSSPPLRYANFGLGCAARAWLGVAILIWLRPSRFLVRSFDPVQVDVGNADTCAESEVVAPVDGKGICLDRAVSFDVALEVCASIGARLCELSEVLAGESKATGVRRVLVAGLHPADQSACWLSVVQLYSEWPLRVDSIARNGGCHPVGCVLFRSAALTASGSGRVPANPAARTNSSRFWTLWPTTDSSALLDCSRQPLCAAVPVRWNAGVPLRCRTVPDAPCPRRACR